MIPARLAAALTERVQEIAVAAHRLLGCRHLSRADLILDPVDGPILLEVNAMPGMTCTSLYPDAANHDGHPFPRLIAMLIRDAHRRSRMA